jgi:fibronectin-binding autotransporter adhesin
MKLKRSNVKMLVASFAFVAATFLTQFSGVNFAHATGPTTNTWVGGTDTNFATAANWDTDTVPVSGNVLVFPNLGNNTYTLTNNLSGVQLGGVTYGVSGASSVASTYTTYNIDTLAFADGATITQGTSSANSNVDVSNSVTAQGSMIFSGTTSPFLAANSATHDINIAFTNVTIENSPAQCSGSSNTYSVNWNPTGTETIAANSDAALIPSASSVIVGSGALLNLPYSTSAASYGQNITFNGGGSTQGTDCGGDALSLGSYSNITLTGTIALNGGNIIYSIYAGTTLTIAGPITGTGSSLTALTAGSNPSAGTFVNSSSNNSSSTPGGTQTVPVTTEPAITDSQPSTNINVASNTIQVLDGTRGNVDVAAAGTLMGNGTATSFTIENKGTIAPGHSPGKLTATSTLTMASGSIYQAQLKDSTQGDYDQIVVGSPSDTTGNDVTINSATLDTELYTGYNIKTGDKFEIINNLSQTAVSGTFQGLAEGATFTAGGLSFSISYIGGDGNDVVLTALTSGAAPTAPDTAVERLILANPLTVLAFGMVAAITVVVTARRKFQK